MGSLFSRRDRRDSLQGEINQCGPRASQSFARRHHQSHDDDRETPPTSMVVPQQAQQPQSPPHSLHVECGSFRSLARRHHQTRDDDRETPQMNDLMVELETPLAVEWYRLGVQLGVPLGILDKISVDHPRSSNRRLSEVLLYWLRNEHRPSWDKICDALRKIGGFGNLWRELKMKYCSLKTSHDHIEVDQSQGGAVIHTCTVNSLISEVANKLDSNIQEAIQGLQRDFGQRVANIRLSFKAVSVTTIKELLKELPAGEVKGQVGLLLSKSDNFSVIMSSRSVDHLFMHLSNIQAWDFLHPQLLEYLVQELGDDEAKGNMEEYKSRLVRFRRRTKMRELSGWFGEITNKYNAIVYSLGHNWKDRTYEEFEVLRVSLLRQEAFFQSSLHLCGVLTGSILVALAIPNFVDIVALKQMLSEWQLLKFITENEIHGIYTKGLCLFRDVHVTKNPEPGEPPHYTTVQSISESQESPRVRLGSPILESVTQYTTTQVSFDQESQESPRMTRLEFAPPISEECIMQVRSESQESLYTIQDVFPPAIQESNKPLPSTQYSTSPYLSISACSYEIRPADAPAVPTSSEDH